jgi:tellurite resistance protein
MNTLSRLKNFPISFFSVVMGLTGFTIGLQKAVVLYGLPTELPTFFLGLSSTIFLTIALGYSLKLWFSCDEVKKEFNHPIKINFFPTISISLLLLSVAFLPINPEISRYLWYTGTILHFIITVKIIGAWMHRDTFKIHQMSPAWFIPAVGNILVPVAGVSLANPEISWFFFSVGLCFWIILLTVFFNRMFFHESLTEKLLPTLFIVIAPPAIGFISYVKLTGGIDSFSKILYYFALFLALLMLSQLTIHYKIRYYLSWWAYSFPLAAISIASVLMYHETKMSCYKNIFSFFMTLLSLLIVLLIYKTVRAIINKEICVED